MGSYRFSTRRHLIMLLIVFLLGSVVVYIVADHIDRNEQNNRQAQLVSVNRRAAFEFSESLDRFVYLMSGVRSFVTHSKEFPSQEELREFVNKQLEDLGYRDSLIISYIDQDHIFRYSFTQRAINPAGLVGTSVRAIRSENAMKRLDEVMKDEEFHLFPVTNLFEGWVGIPLDFNVVRDGKSIGYIAAIADFKSIIEPIYTVEPSDKFVFRFSVNGTEFDRERAYDGTRVFHDREDPKYAGNYDIKEDNYLYSEVLRYGLIFKIGTAYINEYQKNETLRLLIYGWFMMLIGFVSYSLYRLSKFKKLNDSLTKSIDTIEFQKTKLDIQNSELNKLNATKDKFFSIIGHDLKGPLTSISSIVNLWNTKSLDESQTDELMEKLGTATLGASKLLDNLLQWSLVNTGQINWDPEDIALAELVDEVFFQLGASASSKHINLVKDIEESVHLKGDRNMLSTIIRNLVSNGIKFSKANGNVSVKAEKADGSILFKVTDHGEGLTEEERVSLFRLGEGVKSASGTGLGLILVKEFVNRHKGTITVESEKSKGTTFVIRFPT